MGKGTGSGQGAGDGAGGYKGKSERFFIPAMPMPAAIICCILNFLIPGLGTMLSGFSNFCCSRNEDLTWETRTTSCCINFGIGLLQLISFILLFLGWFWSCVWGGFYIVTSLEYYHNNRPEETDQPQERHVTHHPAVSQVVVIQPGPSLPPSYADVMAGSGHYAHAQTNSVYPASISHVTAFPDQPPPASTPPVEIVST
ncbi:uncharacterized protein LOC127832251 [Dreissena polymorpha]|uniref:Protein SPEC3 n=1 Tax=Dreissena polymorpha TaxID=45954 RepID=A0A9D4JNR9_DREPO|nr:uncharacterized protein LOC127832251 [Dreissena polymorpha]KAH3817189.1 hypothetical protein DPMN_118719 [Dreissena polymorpha]